MKPMLKAVMIMFACLLVIGVLWFMPGMNVEQPTVVKKPEQGRNNESSTELDEARLQQIKEEIERAQRKGGPLLNSFSSSYYDPNQEDNLETTPEYEMIKGIKYYVLEHEYVQLDVPESPDASMLVREYMMIDGVTSNKGPYTVKVAIPKQESIQVLKHYLRIEEPDSLELPPNTIVSEQVINQWMEEAYNPLLEYTDESPRRLTIEKLKEQAQSQLEGK